jgi:hypothetical protein
MAEIEHQAYAGSGRQSHGRKPGALEVDIHGRFGGSKTDAGDALHRLLHKAGVGEKTREAAVLEFRKHLASGDAHADGDPRVNGDPVKGQPLSKEARLKLARFMDDDDDPASASAGDDDEEE